MAEAATAASASVASTPTWLALSGKMAPISTILLYMAVSPIQCNRYSVTNAYASKRN